MNALMIHTVAHLKMLIGRKLIFNLHYSPVSDKCILVPLLCFSGEITGMSAETDLTNGKFSFVQIRL